jgi:hypothetical protein
VVVSISANGERRMMSVEPHGWVSLLRAAGINAGQMGEREREFQVKSTASFGKERDGWSRQMERIPSPTRM